MRLEFRHESLTIYRRNLEKIFYRLNLLENSGILYASLLEFVYFLLSKVSIRMDTKNAQNFMSLNKAKAYYM